MMTRTMMTSSRVQEDAALVKLANDLLQQLHVPQRIRHWADINAQVFITLYEGLCGESPSDLVTPAKTRADEVHNCQCVIDSLSSEVLNIPLTHIDGGDVVRGDVNSVTNLLEVFSGLFEYILDKIGSDISTDNDDVVSDGTLGDTEGTEFDPDMVTPEYIDDLLQKELSKGYRTAANDKSNLVSTNKSRSINATDTTAELISQAQRTNITAASLNNTSELIALGNTPQTPTHRQNASALYHTEHAPHKASHRQNATSSYPSSPSRRYTSDKDVSDLSSIHYSLSTAGETGDSTQALIREGESLERRLYGSKGEVTGSQNNTASLLNMSKQSALDSSITSSTVMPQVLRGPQTGSSQFDLIGVRPLPPARPTERHQNDSQADRVTYTHHLYHHFNNTPLDENGKPIPQASGSRSPGPVSSLYPASNRNTNSRPLSSLQHRPLGGTQSDKPSARLLSNLPLQSRVQKENVNPHAQPTSTANSYSYDNLRALVESTVQMSREAITLNSNNNTNGHTNGHVNGHAEDSSDALRTQTRSSKVHYRADKRSPELSQGRNNKKPLSRKNNKSPTEGQGRSDTDHTEVTQLTQAATEDEHVSLDDLVSTNQQYSKLSTSLGSLNGTETTIGATNVSGAQTASTRDPQDSDGTQLSDTGASRRLQSALYLSHPGLASSVTSCNTSEVDDENIDDRLRTTLARVHKQTRHIQKLSDIKDASLNHMFEHKSTQSLATEPQLIQSDLGSRKVSFQTDSTQTFDRKSKPKKPVRSSISARNGRHGIAPSHTDHKPAASATKKSSLSRKTTKSKTTSGSHPASAASHKSTSAQEGKLRRHQERAIPKTFPEYLEKYYGTIDERDHIRASDGELSQHSDSEVNYHRQADDGRGTEKVGSAGQKDGQQAAQRQSGPQSGPQSGASRLQPYTQDKEKSVRFDDILDDEASGQIGDIRRKLKVEQQRARKRAQLLNQVYKGDLNSFTDAAEDQICMLRNKAAEKEDEYRRTVFGAPKKSKFNANRKYGNTCSIVRPRYRTSSRTCHSRKRSASASPTLGRLKGSPDGDLLPWLLEEFPFLHLTTETLHDLWRKSSKQIEQLAQTSKDMRKRKGKAQLQAEEAERRQEILMEIMQKELNHNQRVKEMKDRRVAQVSVKSRLKDKRLQSARARKYYEEFQVGQRSKMMRKKTKEELLFKKLFKQGLDVQKDRVRELRKYATEQREERTRKQHLELQALENYYRDQFEMLSESMANERKDIDVREKAQAKILEKMKRELRAKMEKEIREIQQRIARDEDDEYFRQVDADRLKQRLQLARFQGKI